jgi:hypothetical protein
MEEQIEKARELVRHGERALASAKQCIVESQYADGPLAYEERIAANKAFSKARVALELYRAQLASLEREAAQLGAA